MKDILHKAFGNAFEPALLEEISALGTLKHIPKGDTMIEVGSYINNMPLILSGAIKIMREDDDGDEILLYFLQRGDTCAMTMKCCLGQAQSEIKAVAEQDTDLILIPVQKMSEWTQRYQTWMAFVFASYNTRMNELLESVDSLAFLNLHERLSNYLTEKAKITGSDTLESTHQEIAYDLNTSRVVVSRLLKQLEKEGHISLHRNRISLLPSTA